MLLRTVMHMVKLTLRLYLVILPTIAGYPLRCGLCVANNGVANCVDQRAKSCIRILNSGEEELRDILVARCDQEIEPSNLRILTTFGGKRCNSVPSTTGTPRTPTESRSSELVSVTTAGTSRTPTESRSSELVSVITRGTPRTPPPPPESRSSELDSVITTGTPRTPTESRSSELVSVITRGTPRTPTERRSSELNSVTTTGTSRTHTDGIPSTKTRRTLSHLSTDSQKKRKEDPNHDNLLVDDKLKGMLAWAVVTTIIILLILLKRWLWAKLKCQCCSRMPPATPTSDTQAVPPAPPSTPVPAVHLNPVFTPQTTHTPPSLATTPDTISPTTPSTVKSTRPLISPEEAVSSRTRSKTMRRLSL